MNTPKQFAALVLLSAVNIPLAAFSQGNLTPPGPPSPTMKTLNQIEPRQPILMLPCAISNRGSFYLTTNLTGISGQHGVTILASDVALDLCGFTLAGSHGSLDGIHIATNLARVTVRNGVVKNWDGTGVSAQACDACTFEGLRISGSGGWALVSGNRSSVKDCTFQDNLGGGLDADHHSLVSGCISTGNGGIGIWCPAGATVRDCLAMNNSGDGFTVGDVSVITACTSRDNASTGFALGAGSVIRSCSAVANGGPGIHLALNGLATGCVVRNNGAGGIQTEEGAVVQGCALRQNGGAAGIQVRTGSHVLDNNCFEHTDGEMAGILVVGEGSRVEGNHVCSNQWGIKLEGTANFLFRNTATRNALGSYTNAPGNVIGQVFSVNGGGTITDASPWANFSN